MADGKTHAIGTGFGLLASSCLSAYLVSNGVPDAHGLVWGAIAGHFVTPDLDQHQVKTHDEQRVYKINPILGSIWHKYWLLYGWLIPHRSWLSHALVVGTVIRMAYLFGPIFATMSYYGKQIAYQPWMFYSAMAWCFQDLIHLALDGFGVHE